MIMRYSSEMSTTSEKMKAVARCSSCKQTATVLVRDDGRIQPLAQTTDCCEKGEYEVLASDYVKSFASPLDGWWMFCAG
jgi:hypothetical protein